MNFTDSADFLIERRTIGTRQASAWFSKSTTDDEWDTFLQSNPLGHFQQSAIWSSVKAIDGWQTLRVIVESDGNILGGFQILWRARGPFREGFLNKGPVYVAGDESLVDWLLDLMAMVCTEQHVDVLVAQAADQDLLVETRQRCRGYAANVIADIITATLCIPLNEGQAPAESRMRRTIRLEVRQAIRRGVVVREGDAANISSFFQMMCTTCRRQNTSPNPSSERAMLALWSAFHGKGLARLTIAECDGQPTAGLLSIRFGARVTQWKKGWTEQHREKHPNTLLAFEGIQWAERKGASLLDFVGGQRKLAQAVGEGRPPDKALLASRYFFLLGFGAKPQLLPRALVWCPHIITRGAYRCLIPIVRTFLGPKD